MYVDSPKVFVMQFFLLVEFLSDKAVEPLLKAIVILSFPRHPAGFSASSSDKRVQRNGIDENGGGVVDELDLLTKEAMEKCGCKRCITRNMQNPTKSLNSVSKIDR